MLRTFEPVGTLTGNGGGDEVSIILLDGCGSVVVRIQLFAPPERTGRGIAFGTESGTEAAYNFCNSAPVSPSERLTKTSVTQMMSITKNILVFTFMGALCASPIYGSENEPTPTPSPTASPSATPGGGDDHGGSTSHGDLSLHGLYEGTTANGGVALFYIDGNTHIQINVIDVANQSIGFAEGQMSNGTFTFALSNGQSITGTATEHLITGAVGGANYQAQRSPEFGPEHTAVGRFVGTATGPGGESRVMFVIDSNKHIFMLQTSGTAPNLVRTGGAGTVTPPVAPATAYTFTLNLAVGSTSPITGSFTITDGIFAGTFTTSGGTYTFSSFQSTLVHRMANISTRGMVGTGQGQLIGGFIITGGPKMVLIRASGPSLTAAGVSPVLANPALQLFTNQTVLAQNDDWRTNANATEIAASGLAPGNDLESALLVRLEPGVYTTVVTGSDPTTTGIALVEIYEVNHD